jgi:Transposase IS116/IS110/IS902 family
MRDNPARALDDPMPRHDAPARAAAASQPVQRSPARADRPPISEGMTPARAQRSSEASGRNARAGRKAFDASSSTARAGRTSHDAYEASARADVYDTIRTLGRLLDDLEHVRVQNDNRIEALERARGSALPHLLAIQKGLRHVEHQAELELKRAWRTHPLAPWQKAIPGAGEKLVARLVAETKDPADRPNPAKLLAYCGMGDPRRTGPIPAGATQAELFKRGNPAAKKRIYLVAQQFKKGTCAAHQAARKQRKAAAEEGWDGWFPPPEGCTCAADGYVYRAIYDEARTRYAGAVHDKPCTLCVPRNKPPAPVGSPLSPGHQDLRALRIVAREFLIAMWREARRLRGEPVTVKRGKRGGRKHARANADAMPVAHPPARTEMPTTPQVPTSARAVEPLRSTVASPARAKRSSPSLDQPPARASDLPAPVAAAPARAVGDAKPVMSPPARAVRPANPELPAPARAMSCAKPEHPAPARAEHRPIPAGGPPARAEEAAIPAGGAPARAS